MMSIHDNRPKFYRAIHFPYTERIIPKSSKSTSEQTADPISSTLKQCKKLTNSANDQYIKLRTPGACGLPYSAKFRCGDAFWKLHGEGCLVTIGSDYVAQVSIEHNPELDDVSDFDTSKELLLAHLKIDNVLFDRLMKEMKDTVTAIESVLCEVAAGCVRDPNSDKCLLELWRIADKYGYKINVDFSDEINSKEFIQHNQLKAVIEQHVKQNCKLKERSFYLRKSSCFLGLIKDNFFAQFLQTAIKTHKTLILEMGTPHLKQSILHLEPKHCLLLSKNDIKLFSDLECTLSEQLFKEVLPKIQTNFINQVASINPIDYYQSLPLVSSVYFYVCKSMSETAKRVEEQFGIQKSLMYENEWQVTGIEDSKVSSVSAKCFAKQLQMLVGMANYFEPGKITVKTKYPYKYQIELFNSSNLTHEDLHIWLCLVDATMVDIIQSQESVRTAAYNTLEFVALVEKSGLGTNTQDSEVLRKQLSFIRPDFLCDNVAFSRYRDFLEVFKNYWERFNEVLPKLTSKLEGNHLKLQVVEIKNLLSSIASQVMNKNANPDDVIKFFRAYNDLFTDMDDMPFDWYVRIQDRTKIDTLQLNRIIERVQNEYSDTVNECYQVQRGKYDRFIEICTDDTPKHYQVEVLKTLLNYIENIGLKQTWVNGNELSPKEQLIATVLLIHAIRSSLLYLKEQPDYIDYEKYYKESVKPFSSVIGDSISLQDFTTRIKLIEDSFWYIQGQGLKVSLIKLNQSIKFWYIRNQDSIEIDKALQLLEPYNEHCDRNLLQSSFDRYNEQFMKYVVDYSKLSRIDKIGNIVQDVRSKVRPMRSTEWTTEFKQTYLPRVLAGLAAVWSIQMSRDVANSGKLLQPHLIQILSILRLLHAHEKVTAIEKHRSHILIGQGKSLVLGLIAGLMALFDHDVEVMCCRSYLANRDFNYFKDLFETFTVDKKIVYKTFVAQNEMEQLWTRATKYVYNCIGILDPRLTLVKPSTKLNNAALLIDEEDVFLM